MTLARKFAWHASSARNDKLFYHSRYLSEGFVEEAITEAGLKHSAG